MQFLLWGQKRVTPTVIMVIVYQKMAIQETAICLAYNTLGLWDREVSAFKNKVHFRADCTLRYITHTLMIAQIEVMLLQTTLTSPKSLGNPRHKQGRTSLAPQGTTLLVKKQMWKAHIAPKSQTTSNSHWANQALPWAILAVPNQAEPENATAWAKPSSESSQVARSWDKKSVRVWMVWMLPFVFSLLKWWCLLA